MTGSKALFLSGQTKFRRLQWRSCLTAETKIDKGIPQLLSVSTMELCSWVRLSRAADITPKPRGRFQKKPLPVLAVIRWHVIHCKPLLSLHPRHFVPLARKSCNLIFVCFRLAIVHFCILRIFYSAVQNSILVPKLISLCFMLHANMGSI